MDAQNLPQHHDNQYHDCLIFTGPSALRMLRAQRRKTGFLSWKSIELDEQNRLLRTCAPGVPSFVLADLVRMGAVDAERDDAVHVLVGSAANRRKGAWLAPHVCSISLPQGAIAQVEPGVFTLTPQALCLDIAHRVGPVQAYAVALELCSKISLSDHSEWLPPYRNVVVTGLEKDKDQIKSVGYFEVEPVMTPQDLLSYLRCVPSDPRARQLAALCRQLVCDLRSPMECIMIGMFTLPFRMGGFNCGPFCCDFKIEFGDRAQAIAGMPYAVCDAYQEKAKIDLEYNGDAGHEQLASRIHDEKRNTALASMGIEVLVVNKETLCDLQAMEAIAWRIHQRMNGQYRNRVKAQRTRQKALLMSLRASFGLLPN